MIKYLFIIIFFSLINSSSANNKENIINNLIETKNINFDFEQNVNEKIEKGNCVIEYPKKIFCEYSGSNNKILVSNGKSLVIKTSVSYYRYPLEKTSLNFILDENGSEINIFFDNNSFNLIGWQTKDIYQNLNITFLSSVKKNEPINKNIFKLPSSQN
jgi:outer membrane lipoprotein-sorting protein